jgi:hypothetical protein
MQFISRLSKLINSNSKKPGPYPLPEQLDRPATRPILLKRDYDDRTRPSPRISEQEWLKIQKAMDQAG